MVILHGEQAKRETITMWIGDRGASVQATQCCLFYKSRSMAAHVNIICILIIMYVNDSDSFFSYY